MLILTNANANSVNSRVILPPVDGARGSGGVWSVTSPAHDGHGGPEDRVEPGSHDQKVVRSSRHLLPWRDQRQFEVSDRKAGGWLACLSTGWLGLRYYLIIRSDSTLLSWHQYRTAPWSSSRVLSSEIVANIQMTFL